MGEIRHIDDFPSWPQKKKNGHVSIEKPLKYLEFILNRYLHMHTKIYILMQVLNFQQYFKSNHVEKP